MASKDGLKDLLNLFDPIGFDASPGNSADGNSSSLLGLDLSPVSSRSQAGPAGDTPEKRSNLDLVAQIMPKISDEDIFGLQATSQKSTGSKIKSTPSSKKPDPGVNSASSSCDFIKPLKVNNTGDPTFSATPSAFPATPLAFPASPAAFPATPASCSELLLQVVNGIEPSKKIEKPSKIKDKEKPLISDLSLVNWMLDEFLPVKENGPVQSTDSTSQPEKTETAPAGLASLNLTSTILDSNFDEWLNQFESEPKKTNKPVEVPFEIEISSNNAVEIEISTAFSSKNEPNLENLENGLPPIEMKNGPSTAFGAPRNADKRLLDIWELFQAQSLAINKHHESASHVNGDAGVTSGSGSAVPNFSTPSSTVPTSRTEISDNVVIKSDEIESRDIKNNVVPKSVVDNLVSDLIKAVPSSDSSATPAPPPSTNQNQCLISCATLTEDFEFEKSLPGGLFYVDTHCHLDLLFERLKFNDSYDSFKKIYSPTFSSLYRGCITDFCFPSNFLNNTSYIRAFLQNEDVRAAVGCHPHQSDLYTDDVEQFIMQALSNEKTVAFGECGLDYSSKNNVNPSHQQAVFKRQLRIAKCFSKPLVIHCRNADPDCFSLMKEIIPHDYPIHLHCFTGSYESSNFWSDYFTRLYFGITPGICMQRYRHQIEFVKRVSLNRIVIESDSPYFLPEKYMAHELQRDGLQFNHPGLGSLVAKKIAEVRQLPVEDVLTQIFRNTQTLYDTFY